MFRIFSTCKSTGRWHIKLQLWPVRGFFSVSSSLLDPLFKKYTFWWTFKFIYNSERFTLKVLCNKDFKCYVLFVRFSENKLFDICFPCNLNNSHFNMKRHLQFVPEYTFAFISCCTFSWFSSRKFRFLDESYLFRFPHEVCEYMDHFNGKVTWLRKSWIMSYIY